MKSLDYAFMEMSGAIPCPTDKCFTHKLTFFKRKFIKLVTVDNVNNNEIDMNRLYCCYDFFFGKDESYIMKLTEGEFFFIFYSENFKVELPPLCL